MREIALVQFKNHAVSNFSHTKNTELILFNKYELNKMRNKLISIVIIMMKTFNKNKVCQYVVLELKRKDSIFIKYLNVSFITDRIYNNECIINNCSFAICNIYIQSLLLLKKIINGEYLLCNNDCLYIN